jgi:DNA-binding MarR family transcriptional regulator
MRPSELQPEELAIMRRISGLPLDHVAMAVMSNIWRAAQAFKVKMEQTVLRQYDLSFGAFSTLFIVWIWGPIETRDLAKSQGVTRATITSTVTLLEDRGLVGRHNSLKDRRLVLVQLTSKGKKLIQSLFPAFNRAERQVACVLSTKEQRTLAHLLRKVLQGMRATEADTGQRVRTK